MGTFRETDGRVSPLQVIPGRDEAMGDANNPGRPQILTMKPHQFRRVMDAVARALRLGNRGQGSKPAAR